MKTIEQQCRTICLTGGYDPDGIAAQEIQDMAFSYPVGSDGLVKVWMQWITTVEGGIDRKDSPSREEREKEECRAYLAKMVEISEPGNRHEYWPDTKHGNIYHTSNN